MNDKRDGGEGKKKKFHVVLIKPSHYDDDGYVIQWRWSGVPSNTLAVLYGLVRELARKNALGKDVDIVLSAYDETHTRVPVDKIIEEITSSSGGGIVGFAGVQSNQFPRAMDMAARFREAGVQVCIGGFHVSGCLAMLEEPPEEIRRTMDMGVSLFAGEAEGRFLGLLKDALDGKLRPVYNYLDELPGLESSPGPFLPAELLGCSSGSFTSFDAGRGCPFKCSFCTIINVQGRQSRRRSVEDVERIIRENLAQGISRFFITDDNFARNRDWEAIFDCIIRIQREEGVSIRLTIQVDTMCHRIPGFIEKAGKAGVARVFIGLENINPENLKAAGKRQNKIAEYRRMLQAWRDVGAITCAGYIIGFPADTPERIIKDIKTIQEELPVDLLEFFVLTPLPGSEDHRRLLEDGGWMDPDLNNYDLNHVTTRHPTMTREEWERAYRTAWDTYYSTEHIETVLRRARASGMSIGKVLFLLLWFYVCIKHEGIHPLEGGYMRRKYRLDRRPGLPIESPLTFYPKRAWEFISSHARLAPLLWKCTRMRRRIKADPGAAAYRDKALMPPPTEPDEEQAPPGTPIRPKQASA